MIANCWVSEPRGRALDTMTVSLLPGWATIKKLTCYAHPPNRGAVLFSWYAWPCAPLLPVTVAPAPASAPLFRRCLNPRGNVPMLDIDDFSHAVAGIYDASMDVERWPGVMAQLAGMFRGTASQIGVGSSLG